MVQGGMLCGPGRRCRDQGAAVSETALLGGYAAYVRRSYAAAAAMLAALAAVTLCSLMLGASGLSFWDIVLGLAGKGSAVSQTVLWNIRLPRICAAIAVGMALSLAGCMMQNVLRNPLASSSTLGVSQGAGFGAAFAIVFFEAGIQADSVTAYISQPWAVTVCAFLGGLATTAVILGLSRFAGVTPASMILAGVALSSLFAGGTTIIQYYADDTEVASVVYWTFGDLGRTGFREIGLIFMLSLCAFVFFYRNYWNYNALESGAGTAKSLGVQVDRLVLATMVLATFIASVAVAFVGTISFVGLVAPHMARRFVGNNYRFLLPCSALTGAIIMVLAELVSRMLISPGILPIGALTSFLGAPVFLYMIFKKGGVR